MHVPGLLMYMWMVLCASSDWRYNSCATIRLEYSSLICRIHNYIGDDTTKYTFIKSYPISINTSPASS